MGCCLECNKGSCLNKISIFNKLTALELLDVRANIDSREYKKGEMICIEGDNAKTLYFIDKGKIKVYKNTKFGKEQILHILSEGDFLGELNLLKDSNYKFNAVAMTDCKICSLTKDELKHIIMRRPEIGIKMLEILAERLTETESLVQNISNNDGDSKIAYLLMDLAAKYGDEVGDYISIDLPISRDDMASYTGVTRETISRKLKKFQDEGIIKVVGTKKIVVLKESELKEYI